jgi:hypothetical protein
VQEEEEEEEEGCTLESISFFLSPYSINLRTNILLLFSCLSNAELILTCTSSRESGGFDHTSGVTSGLQMIFLSNGLGDVDGRCIFLDEPLSCHIVT